MHRDGCADPVDTTRRGCERAPISFYTCCKTRREATMHVAATQEACLPILQRLKTLTACTGNFTAETVVTLEDTHPDVVATRIKPFVTFAYNVEEDGTVKSKSSGLTSWNGTQKPTLVKTFPSILNPAASSMSCMTHSVTMFMQSAGNRALACYIVLRTSIRSITVGHRHLTLKTERSPSWLDARSS